MNFSSNEEISHAKILNNNKINSIIYIDLSSDSRTLTVLDDKTTSSTNHDSFQCHICNKLFRRGYTVMSLSNPLYTAIEQP
jgi:hypothetical protein